MDHLERLILAWQVTGREAYAHKARSIILAWTDRYIPSANAINDNKLDPIWAGYASLRHGFTSQQQAALHEWMRRIAQGMMDSAARGQNTGNNWQTKRIKIVATIGWTLNQPDLLQWARDQYAIYVQNNFYPDGTSRDLKQRDALHYH